MINLQEYGITILNVDSTSDSDYQLINDPDGDYCYVCDVQLAIEKLVSKIKELEEDYKQLEHEYGLAVSPRYAIGE